MVVVGKEEEGVTLFPRSSQEGMGEKRFPPHQVY
jgi:hypothetical protein